MATKSKVGILGSGQVARTLGTGFAAHGYDVRLGSRVPSKLDAWRRETPGTVSTGTLPEASAHGNVVVLATLGSATETVLELAQPKNFHGKLVLDATNPLDFANGMPPGLLLGTNDSLGERVQRRLPDAKVVKCFNTVGNSRMIDPKFREGTPLMLICGNDPSAKRQTEELLRDLGWPGVLDVGGIEGARWLEALVPLWVRAGQALNTFEHAFKVVR